MNLRWLLFAAVTALCAGFAVAQSSKPPEKWSYEEAYRLLTDSPWAPAHTGIDVRFGHETIYRDNYAGVRTREVTPNRQETLGARVTPGRSASLPSISVLWWSSRTVRLAEQRVAQFRKRLPADHKPEAAPLEHLIIAVDGSEPLRILRDAGTSLKDSVYLELPGGRALEPLQIRFVEGQRAGDDRVFFHFPRAIAGEPTVTNNTVSAVFVCKAASEKPVPGQMNSLALRVQFQPTKMSWAGQPDL